MTILVIGDYIQDVYWHGTCDRISPEAPVPIIKNIKVSTLQGGAGNVTENLHALGSEYRLIRNPNQITIKTRIVADGHIVCRIDSEEYTPFKISSSELRNMSDDADYAILSDYDKGVLDDAQNIVTTLTLMSTKVIVDPKKNFSAYRGAWLIKANKKEFENEIGRPIKGMSDIHNLSLDMIRGHNIYNIIVTLGAEGCFLTTREGEGYHIQAEGHDVKDVTGAGDVFVAALAHFLDRGDSLLEATKKANTLAGISVAHFGTYVVTPEDIAKLSKKIIFTNGCFDLIHRGHIDYLKKSRELGDRLVVGLNSDESVKRLKGEGRPINKQEDRKAVLESLSFVDEVIIFDEDTPYELIKKVKPSIITKGGDYDSKEKVVGHDLADVVILPYINGYSTTGVINETRRNS
jgi:D-beta-D-heptose 7-phosphate kinase/D-beta-D-heptose 1-phosphate adenosyltransferase